MRDLQVGDLVRVEYSHYSSELDCVGLVLGKSKLNISSTASVLYYDVLTCSKNGKVYVTSLPRGMLLLSLRALRNWRRTTNDA